MKKLIGILIIAFLLVLPLALPATAASSLYGYTGLILIPTAETNDAGLLTLGADFINIENTFIVTGNYGLSDNWEAGLMYASNGPEGITVHSKYMFPAVGGALDLAIGGAINLDGGMNAYYVVASHQLSGSNLSLHAGMGFEDFNDGFFAGADADITPELNLMVEYDSYDVNAGLRYTFADNFSATLGLIGLSELIAQVTYNVSLF